MNPYKSPQISEQEAAKIDHRIYCLFLGCFYLFLALGNTFFTIDMTWINPQPGFIKILCVVGVMCGFYSSVGYFLQFITFNPNKEK